MVDTSRFSLSPVRGFLPEQDPLQKLPSYFTPWEELSRELPKLYASAHLRRKIESLPTLSTNDLQTAAELERAMVVLSYIGHSYLWCEQTPAAYFPSALAVPWHAVATKLGRPPVLSYASYALHNWYRIDPTGPVALGNIALLQNFLAGVDEEWFVLIHIDIEQKAAPGLQALFAGQSAVSNNDNSKLEQALSDLESSLSEMNTILKRMPEYCDPYIYYNRVRPYINGWKKNPAVPEGMRYQGVSEYNDQPQQFRGETGAQSSIIPAIDAFLAVEHEHDMLYYHLQEMRDYMPPAHRACIEALEAGPNVRTYVQQQSQTTPRLKKLYNACLLWVDAFRAQHLQYAADYIFRQNQTGDGNPTKIGTGGTPFMDYLLKHQQTTTRHLLP